MKLMKSQTFPTFCQLITDYVRLSSTVSLLILFKFLQVQISPNKSKDIRSLAPLQVFKPVACTVLPGFVGEPSIRHLHLRLDPPHEPLRVRHLLLAV